MYVTFGSFSSDLEYKDTNNSCKVQIFTKIMFVKTEHLLIKHFSQVKNS